MTITKEEILSKLGTIDAPGQKVDIITAGLISSIVIKEGSVGFAIEANDLPKDMALELKARCEEVLAKSGIRPTIAITSKSKAKPVPPVSPRALAGVKHIIVIASGKGGVGKSTVAVNLAISLARMGVKTGLVDADIHGPSIAKMMNVSNQPEIKDNKMIPQENYGVKCLSMGMLFSSDTPAIWRGPMLSKALQQLFFSARWEDIDVLIVDSPPGTGDIHLSLSQNVKISGVIAVSTPQDIALIDVIKCIKMYQKIGIPILGIIQNMSYFEDPISKNKTYIFGQDGAKRTATDLAINFLGEIPIDSNLCSSMDRGNPITYSDTENYISKCYKEMTERVTRCLKLSC